MTILENFIITSLHAALERKADKLEAEFPEGSAKVYWCGTVVRIDVKPVDKKAS